MFLNLVFRPLINRVAMGRARFLIYPWFIFNRAAMRRARFLPLVYFIFNRAARVFVCRLNQTSLGQNSNDTICVGGQTQTSIRPNRVRDFESRNLWCLLSLSTYLRKLRNDKIIDEATFHKILPTGSSPGVLYGVPKVHKTGCPFRPIVSSVSTYNYNLASYLVGILQPISTNQHAVKDSLTFTDWAKKHKHDNGIMCSFV